MTKIISILSVMIQLYTTGHCLAQNRTARADSARKELRLRVGFGTLGKAQRNNVLGGVVAEISQDISKSSSIRLGCSFNLDRLGIQPLTADSFLIIAVGSPIHIFRFPLGSTKFIFQIKGLV